MGLGLAVSGFSGQHDDVPLAVVSWLGKTLVNDLAERLAFRFEKEIEAMAGSLSGYYLTAGCCQTMVYVVNRVFD